MAVDIKGELEEAAKVLQAFLTDDKNIQAIRQIGRAHV